MIPLGPCVCVCVCGCVVFLFMTWWCLQNGIFLLLENFNNFLSCMFSVLSLEHLLSDVRLPEFIPLGLLTF